MEAVCLVALVRRDSKVDVYKRAPVCVCVWGVLTVVSLTRIRNADEAWPNKLIKSSNIVAPRQSTGNYFCEGGDGRRRVPPFMLTDHRNVLV